MKKNYSLSLLYLILVSGYTFAQTTITEWTFTATNNTTIDGGITSPQPSTGSGTISLIGGITASLAGGVGTVTTCNTTNGEGCAWNTTAYPAQSTNPGTAGIEFAVSTVGQSNIGITFNHRASGTASRWARFEYSVDGVNWISVGTNNAILSPHDAFTFNEVDLTTCTSCNNNPNFKFRIVSIFAPFEFCENGSVSFGANIAYQRANAASLDTGCVGTGNYGTSGTWRFDNIKVIGGFVLSTPSFTDEAFEMYPNPSNSVVNFSKEVSGQILNINGQVLVNFVNATQFNVESLPTGLYLIKTTEGLIKKLVVK
ncbi:MAG: T9SS type A sorting domain-containing protein [Flavobacterium sp.]